MTRAQTECGALFCACVLLCTAAKFVTLESQLVGLQKTSLVCTVTFAGSFASCHHNRKAPHLAATTDLVLRFDSRRPCAGLSSSDPTCDRSSTLQRQTAS